MTIFLTKEEGRRLERNGPSSRLSMFLVPEKVCQDDGYTDPWMWYRFKEFTDEEAKRIAESLATFRDMFPGKISDKLLDGVFSIAEESHLPVILVLKCLEDMLRTHKSSPTLAHFVEVFDAMEEQAKSLFETLLTAQKRFARCTHAIREAMSPETVERIRAEIPDFPEVDELAQAWKSIFEFSFGTFHSLDDTEKAIPKMIEGLAAAEPWPMVPLYCMWLADTISADDRVLAGAHFFEHIVDEDAVEECYSPRNWRRLISELPSLDRKELEENNYCYEFFSEAFTTPEKDRVAAMWARETARNRKSSG